MAPNSWHGKPLSLKVIGTNAGTSMDGLDIVHIHYTQQSPDAPLKMKLLRAGEVGFDGQLKSEHTASIFSYFLSWAKHEADRVMNLIRQNKTSPEEMAIVNIQVWPASSCV